MDPNAALVWADAQLAAAGVDRLGEIELNRARPWSTTWRLPTELGTLWLKACSPAGSYEAALTSMLAQAAAEWSLQPLAADLSEGWLLLPDGGPDLRSVLADASADVVVERWISLLREYAALQRRLVEFVPHLLAIGVPDLRPQAAPELLRRLAAERTDEPLRGRLLGYVPAFAQACARLASRDVPPTLQHDDLHDAAALCGDDGLGPPAFFDWGDAMVSHPFASLLVVRRVLAMILGVPVDDPRIARVTDSYLGEWTDLHPMAELRAQLGDVLQLAKLGRAWSWERALADAPPADWEEWDQPVIWWLGELV